MDEIIKYITEAPLVYLAAINIISFCLFAIDKLKAISNGWRISEKTLLSISAIGGAFGGLFAMKLCRHKTKKPFFKYGLPVMVAIHALILIMTLQ